MMNIENDCMGCCLSDCSFIKLSIDYLCPCKTCLVKVMCNRICKNFVILYHKGLNEITDKEKCFGKIR
jgi:hypothetical protein